MTIEHSTNYQRPSRGPRLPFYYGWINLGMAALAMTATLPGRTHGLGLITEPLVTDLQMTHTQFASLNLVATLLGALAAIPIGLWIDRWGVRVVGVSILLPLSVTVLAMSGVTSVLSLGVCLTLVRGLGQSALSVASMAMIGKWFQRRLGWAMGLFAILLTFGFIGSVLYVGQAVQLHGWRAAWQGIGWAIFALSPCCWLFVRSSPEAIGLETDEMLSGSSDLELAPPETTLKSALNTPVFWVVMLAGSAFNLVWSALTLFNESMLTERGLPPTVAVEIMAVLTGTGLLANLIAGKYATRQQIVKLMAVGMALLTGALLTYPSIRSLGAARLYASLLGLSGGIVTVVFFAAGGHLFGRSHLARVQSVSQFATVCASAIGPLAISELQARQGSYSPACYVAALLTATLSVAAWWTPMPNQDVGATRRDLY